MISKNGPAVSGFRKRWGRFLVLSAPAGLFVLIGDGTDDMAGIADSHRVIGDVLHHDAAAADNHIAADGHARHHLHACADPDIVPHCDKVGILKPGVAALEVDGVTSSLRRTSDGPASSLFRSFLYLLQKPGIRTRQTAAKHPVHRSTSSWHQPPSDRSERRIKRFLRTGRAYCPDRWLPGHAAGIPVLSCSRAEIPVPAHCPSPGPRS